MTEPIWAITMVAEEEDIIGYTISHLLSQDINGILIADNVSKDGTRTILEHFKADYPRQIMIAEDAEIGYHQSKKMTMLAQIAARSFGATIILPFDADELWYSIDPSKTVGGVLREFNGIVSAAEMWNHYYVQSDIETEINPYRKMVWRSIESGRLAKCAYRYSSRAVIDMGNHQILDHHGNPVPSQKINLGIRHFPYRSAEQFVRKAKRGYQAMLAAPSLPRSTCLHWREYGESIERHGEEQLKDHYRRHFTFGVEPTNNMVFDPAPYRGLL
jgi:hypothetical protein